MKTIVLYGRRTPCWMVLNYLVSAHDYFIKVISDDRNVLWVAAQMGKNVEMRSWNERGNYDLFLCVHGTRILTVDELIEGGVRVNIHPTKYDGHNPVKTYIDNKDTDGLVRAMYMTKEVDKGEIIHQEYFETPICSTHADFYNVSYIHYLRTVDKILEKVL